MATILHPDPFNAVLLSSEPLVVSEEQRSLIKEILDISSSDSRFAEKAYAAIWRVLTGGSVKAPVVSSLTPNSAEIGDPSFLLHVHGTNFTSGSIIIFNGGEEPTTYVSATEVTTTVDMTTVTIPLAVPVAVLSEDGVQSEPLMFTFTDGSAVVLGAKSKTVEPVYPKEPVTPLTPKVEKKDK